MSARSSSPRLRAVPPPESAPRAPRRCKRTVAEQVAAAFQAGAVSAGLGLAFGGAVPVAAHAVALRAVALAELHAWWGFALALLLDGACLLFSAPTVAAWGREAFGSRAKALGLAVLLEALLVTGAPLGLGWLSWGALGLLCFVNATSAAARFARVGAP